MNYLQRTLHLRNTRIEKEKEELERRNAQYQAERKIELEKAEKEIYPILKQFDKAKIGTHTLSVHMIECRVLIKSLNSDINSFAIFPADQSLAEVVYFAGAKYYNLSFKGKASKFADIDTLMESLAHQLSEL